MKNPESTKTLTASLPQDAQSLFAWIADPENLSRWHCSFCRSLRKENGALIVESPRGPVPTRFIRNDHSLVLDILAEVVEGIELTNALRVLRNGIGSEVIWTLVKPEGVSESVFHEQIRWAGSALQTLRKTSLSEPAQRPPESVAPATPTLAIAKEPAEPLQEPSSAETASLPQSGKKLFIGNLSYAWTDTELRAHFAEQGSITTAEIARFRGRGGRSRGFGFVEMATEAEAQTAIDKLHGGMAGGRQIIVRLAKSQESRPAPQATLPGTGEQAAEPSGTENRSSEPRQQKPSPRGRARRLPNSGRSASPRRPDSPSRSGGRRPSTGARQPYIEKDITNKSGYEIFPRGGRAENPSNPSSSSERPRSTLDPSPYMDDTGDIENHGGRPPRRPPGRRP